MGGLWDRRKKPSNARNDRELSRDILGVCAHQPHRRALEMVVKVTVWLSERWTWALTLGDHTAWTGCHRKTGHRGRDNE